MRLLYCFDVYYPNIGGGEIYYQHIAEAMVKKGHSVAVVTMRTDPDSPEQETHNGVVIYRVKTPARILFALFALPVMLRLGKKADIIHTSTFAAAFPSYFVGRRYRKPTVITIHEIFGTLWFRFLSFISACISYYGEKAILGLGFDAVIGPSRYTTSSLRLTSKKIKDERLFTIYHGVDTQDWKVTPQRTKRGHELMHDIPGKIVLFYGRSGVSKGLEYAIAAMKDVKDPEATFVAITPFSNARFRYMQQLVKKLGLEERVIFRDSLPFADLVSCASVASVIVIPSLVEGFGFVAVEASTLGKPLVVSECASLPEVVSGDVVFARPSSPESIAEGIDRALGGKTHRIPAKIFKWEDSIAAHLAVYEKVVSHG
jgi:glycosyltransferase involved in cell wall biosynthesis